MSPSASASQALNISLNSGIQSDPPANSSMPPKNAAAAAVAAANKYS